MSEKMFNTRIQHKHDVEANWLKAMNFVPKAGELIVYDPDENYSYPRIKIGDGLAGVNDLLFAERQSDWNENREDEISYIKNRPFYEEIVKTDCTGLSYIISGAGTAETLVSHNQAIPLELEQVWNCTRYHYSAGWMEYRDFEVQQADDGTLYLGSPDLRDSDDNLVIYLTSNEFMTPSGMVSQGYTEFNFTCVSGFISETKIHYIDPKFIKDMYYETPEISTVANITSTDNGLYIDYALELNKPYIVRVDGNVYSFDALIQGAYHSASGYYIWYLGAQPQISGTVNIWDYPFAIYAAGYNDIVTDTEIVFEDGTSNHTVEFIESESKIHYLNPKYIKDMYYETEPTETEILPGITLEFTSAGFEGANFLDTIDLVQGNTYIVNWDDTRYECVCYSSAAGLSLGSAVVGDAGNVDNGEPFFIALFEGTTILTSEIGTHTISITTVEQEIHQIHHKYIKDMYYEEEILTPVNEKITINCNSATEYDGFSCYVGSAYAYWIGGWPNLVGKTVRVIFNDQPYDIVIEQDRYMGSLKTLPFALYETSDRVYFYVFESGSCTFEFYLKENIIKQVDYKYLPILEEVPTVIFEANNIQYDQVFINSNYNMLLGNYTVVVDGVYRNVEFIQDIDFSYVESDLVYIETWNAGEDWEGGFYFSFPDEEVHSVQILDTKYVVKEEHLPDSALTQSDWNQNDETAVDYIKNRTHYEEEKLVDIKDQTYKVTIPSSSGASNIGEDAKFQSHGLVLPFELGQIWNYSTGFTTFENLSVKQTEDGTLYLGSHPYGVLDDAPFCITQTESWTYSGWNDSKYITDYILTGVSGTYTEYVLHQLDPKFIKDMYYEEENIINIAGLEYNFDVNYSATTYSANLSLELGQVWNGWHDTSRSGNLSLNYENLEVQEDTDGQLYVGDLNLSSVPFYVKGQELVLSDRFLSMINPSIIKFEGVSGVITSDPIVHQIDEKYIPWPDENDALELVMEMGLVDPVVAEDSSVYTDENGAMYSL